MPKAITKINGYYLKDVDVRNKVPNSTKVEDGKIYLLNSSGTKLDNGTSLPTSSSGGGSTTDLTEVNNKISTLETSMITNTNKVTQLETKTNSMDSSINDIKTNMTTNTNKVTQLETKTSTIDSSINNIQTSTNTNTNKITQLETKSNEADSKINSLVTALNGTTIKVLTKSQYESLSAKDPNTLYFVKKES